MYGTALKKTEAERREARNAFLMSAFRDPTFLEDATGLTEMRAAADDAEWVGSDSDADDF